MASGEPWSLYVAMARAAVSESAPRTSASAASALSDTSFSLSKIGCTMFRVMPPIPMARAIWWRTSMSGTLAVSRSTSPAVASGTGRWMTVSR
jgi:hypothetical protein